jgi:hypothetical protein
MKKHLFLIVAAVSLFGVTVTRSGAQAPSSIPYQAIVRDNTGNTIVSQPVNLLFNIRRNSPTGTTVYSESHSKVTNEFGLITALLGGGTVQSGVFSSIDWGNGTYFLQVFANSNDMGTTQLMSVPYSFYSRQAANGLAGTAPNYYIQNTRVGIGTSNPLSTLSVTGKTASDSAIFEVKNNNGVTVFAVYNEGVRVYIDESAKAAKGGFAVGGFSQAKGTVQEWLRITRDSSRIYVNNAAMKGAKGGFAVGGFGNAKAGAVNYVSLTAENSIMGYGAGQSLTPAGTGNFIAGYNAGKKITTGSTNVMIGQEAGFSNNSNTNVFIGTSAAYSNVSGFGSVVIGDLAGYNSNGSRNIMMGRNAGYENGAGMDNVFIGAFSGEKIPNSQFNTFIGTESGQFSTDGWNNVFIGHRAGYVAKGSTNVVIGDLAGSNDENYLNPPSTYTNSVMVGPAAGLLQQSGSANTYLGSYAGRNNISGSGNVFIGSQAGQTETGSNKLIISNYFSGEHLIYGEFSYGNATSQKVRIGGSLEIANTPTGTGTVAVIDANGKILKQSSSRIFKSEIEPLVPDVSEFLKLRPVTFKWNTLSGSPGRPDMGLIAEEVDVVFPEIAIKDLSGKTEGVNYNAVSIMTLSVVQQQELRIRQLEEALAYKSTETENLRKRISENEKLTQELVAEINRSKKSSRKNK